MAVTPTIILRALARIPRLAPADITGLTLDLPDGLSECKVVHYEAILKALGVGQLATPDERRVADAWIGYHRAVPIDIERADPPLAVIEAAMKGMASRVAVIRVMS